MKNIKVALVHDYLKEYGGAERVLETLHEIWPKGPIYTSIFLPKFAGPNRHKVEKWNVKTSFLQHVPFKAKFISLARLIAPFLFKSFDLSEYDVVIVSSTGTYTSPNFIKTAKKTLHICYYHTPPRYLYGYPVANAWEEVDWRRMLRFFGQVPMHFLRLIDFKAAQIPDFVIANSEEVSARIKKFYRRNAWVIYPPVDIPDIRYQISDIRNRAYYLAGGRLARHKGIDLAIKACTKLNLPLKVFGRGFASYGEEHLRKLAGPTVEFLGEVADEQKLKLMAGAKAFIFPSEYEDFGIIPVEAMAVGTPVIALRSGGVVETVIDGKTGVFFDPPASRSGGTSEGQGEPAVESLIKAIKRFEKMKINPEDCINQAKKLSKERLKKQMLQFVASHA